MKVKIGTRKSKLALWQAEYVSYHLRKAGIEVELVTMETRGDKIQNVSISKIGSKGVFTEELEEKLENGSIDIAVHSAKDMQSVLPEGFEIIAFTEREKVNDVIVADKPLDLESTLTLGTSSTRRIAYFRHFYPHIKLVDMRGNLQTRFSKMREGHCDGMVLAYAGVHRMGYHNSIQHFLETDKVIPAVGQGSVAIESHVNLDSKKRSAIRSAINHGPTESLLQAERKYLEIMNGGCSIPIFGLATHNGDGIQLNGGIISLDGKKMIRETATGADPVEVGQQLAKKVKNAGGDEILKEIRSQM